MQLGHIISYETCHSARKICWDDCRRVIRVVNLTNNEELIVTKTLRAIHDDNEVTSLLDDESIELLIVILREIEKNVRAVATITLYASDRNSLNSLNLNVPFNNKGINALKAILWFALSIKVLKGFGEMCDCILIIHRRNKTKSGWFNRYVIL